MLATAHATIGAVTGLGRPRDLSKPLAHAYVTGMVGEFQGFARDLHDLTVQRLIDASAADPRFVSVLTEGLTRGRALDRNNSDLRTIKADFGRLGLSPLDLGVHDARWSSNDSNELPLVFNLRTPWHMGMKPNCEPCGLRKCKTPSRGLVAVCQS